MLDQQRAAWTQREHLQHPPEGVYRAQHVAVGRVSPSSQFQHSAAKRTQGWRALLRVSPPDNMAAQVSLAASSPLDMPRAMSRRGCVSPSPPPSSGGVIEEPGEGQRWRRVLMAWAS